MTRVLKDYVHSRDTHEKQNANPLFIYMAHQTVHIPIQYRREEERCAHLTHHVRRQYCNMMVELDDAVGDMVDQLHDLELWNNTLILTLTDNGGMVNWQHDKNGNPTTDASQGSNFPLRGSKTTLYDGGIRALAFAAGGYVPVEGRGRRIHDLAHVVDLTATILAITGVLPAKREYLRLDGNSLFGLIANQPGATAVRDHVPINIIQAGRRYSAVRFGKHKLIVDDCINYGAQGWFDENGNLLEAPPSRSRGNLLLFDLERDPEERKNIAKRRPHLVKYGQDLIRMYVVGGEYMEPQDSMGFHPQAFPQLHGGVWKPFLHAKEWQKFWSREKAKAARNAKKYYNDVMGSQEDLIHLHDELDHSFSSFD